MSKGIDRIDQIEDPKEKANAVKEMLKAMIEEANEYFQQNNTQKSSRVNKQTHETSSIHLLNQLTGLNILNKFVNTHDKPLCALPSNFHIQYRRFVQVIDQKQTVKCFNDT